MSTISREEFAEKVKYWEEIAIRDPQSYRWRVLSFAALGYVYLFGLASVTFLLSLILVGMVFSRGGVLALRFLLPVVGLLGAIVRALWVRFERPKGIAIAPSEAPFLYRRLEEMAGTLVLPRLHKILLTTENNASIAQYPRLGIFGWYENYLVIGLPLLLTLSPEEFEAVLAHELGHVSARHGQLSSWIYRVHRTWQQLVGQTEGRKAANVVLRFFQWYSPRFAIYSFALRRQAEYEADHCSALVTSPGITAQALCSCTIWDTYLDQHFWDPLKRSIWNVDEPPDTLYTDMLRFVRTNPPTKTGAELALRPALMVRTGTTDTHPCLQDRLSALQQQPTLSPALHTTAAEHFLGASLERFLSVLSQQWSMNIRKQWNAWYLEARQDLKTLKTLDEKASLSSEEAWRRAVLTERFQGAESAIPLYEALYTDAKWLLPAKYAVGRILLEQDDAAGIPLMEEAIAKKREATLPGLGHLYGYYCRQGEATEVARIHRLGMQSADKEDKAQKERQSIGDRQTVYIHHGLDAAQVENVRVILSLVGEIGEAYLVRKYLVHYPEDPLYVLGVTLSREYLRLRRDHDRQRLLKELQVALQQSRCLPLQSTYFLLLTREYGWLKKAMRDVPEALVFKA